MLMNDEFVKGQFSVPGSVLRKILEFGHFGAMFGNCGFPALTLNRLQVLALLRTENCLVRGFLLRHMPQAAAFDQAVEVFGEIRGVVSGAL
jgi:hypothetical protein